MAASPFKDVPINGVVTDSIEEKVSKDGVHSKKEVHNDHGHRTVTITEEKEIAMPGAKDVKDVASKVMENI